MARIECISSALPFKKIDNDCLEGIVDGWSAKKIAKKIGIKSRFVVEEDETALDLAINACEKLFKNNKTKSKDEIDYLLLCTQSPDYFLPTTACILQDKIGLPTTCAALDFNQGCSGFIYGLSLAKGLLSSGQAKNVLLVTSETYSRHIDKKDVANRSIFGDGATATIISQSEEAGIGEFSLGTDGSGYQNLIVRNGGCKHQKTGQPEDFLYMNGPEIFNFTIKSVPKLVEKTLLTNNLSLDDIDYAIFHQANAYMLNHLQKKCNIPTKKFYINMENVGNTVSSTIPLGLEDSLARNLISPGNKVLIVGFGVGYSFGATVITV